MKLKYYILSCLILMSMQLLQAQEVFQATLAGRHEVLPIQSNGTGSVQATLTGNQLVVTGSFSDLDGLFDPTVAGGSHLHIGYAGEAGAIAVSLNPVLDLDARGGTYLALNNTFMLTADQIAALQARRMYLNIHSTKFGGGELRGQLLPEADAHYYINLFGSNEVPVAMTQAHGALALEVHGDSLVVTGAFADLEGDFDASVAGGAHLHTAMAGATGGVDIFINASTGADLSGGVFTATDNKVAVSADQIARLAARAYYANLHSTKFPGGELRGQVTTMAQTAFRAHLSGSNQNPTVMTAASGQIQAELVGDSLFVSGRFDDLESPVATAIAGGLHLHLGMAGSNGPVAIVLNTDFDTDMMGGTLEVENNAFVLTPEQRTAIQNRGIYINIHTLKQMGGELRGQLLPETQIVLHGNLLGIFEIPNVSTTAYGALKGELMGDQLIVSGSYNNLLGLLATEIAGGAHLHLGAAGSTGPVEFALNSGTDLDLTAGVFASADNAFTLTSDQITAVRNRMYYANIHSAAFGSGELRAQLNQEASYYLTAPLSGASETPAPVNTTASGMLVFEVTGPKVVAHGSFNDLSSAVNTEIAGGAHLHGAMAGQSGSVAYLLNSNLSGDAQSGVFAASSNQFDFTSDDINTLRNRGFYANIHSMDVGSGELRGQTLALANAYFTTSLSGLNEVTPNSSNASGALKLELNGDSLYVSGAFAGLESDYNVNIAGGAHLHIGGPSASGGVDLLLNTDLSADLRAGTYQVTDNRFALDAAQKAVLMAASYYANIHSTAIASGELRGQILSEINLFPMNPPSILTPQDSGLVALVGDLSDLVNISWTAGATDDTELTYIWQVAPTPAFDTIVFQTNTGAATSLALTVGALDNLLASLNVAAGANATVYHRAVVSDGANQTPGNPAQANFKRSDDLAGAIFKATLSGRHEVLPIQTAASGMIEAGLNGNQLVLRGTFSNLTSRIDTSIVGGAHLHLGLAGETGPVAIPIKASFGLDGTSGMFLESDNTFTLTDEQVTALQNRGMYVNIHSTTFGSGELRGQLLPAADAHYYINMFGSNEVPVAMTQAHGALALEVHGDSLVITGAFADLEGDFDAGVAGGAHLHSAMAGANGSVDVFLTATLGENLRDGIFTAADNKIRITSDQKARLAARGYYANIHTTKFGGGELRGQVTAMAQTAFRAHLSGSNQNPTVISSASGQIQAELIGDSLYVSGRFDGLESAVATEIAGGLHLHLGMAGSNGPVAIPLSADFDSDGMGGTINVENNTYGLTTEQKAALNNRSMYLNIHTAGNMGGELRGQLLPEAQIVFHGNLLGIFEIPNSATPAYGALKAELMGDQLIVSGSYNDLQGLLATDIAGGAHLHLGAAGSNGGIEFPLTSDLHLDLTAATFAAASNSFTLDADQIQAIRARKYYANVHSLAQASGEVRAQLVQEANYYMTAPLSGASQTPAPVNTEARGMIVMEVSGNKVVAHGSFANMSSAVDTSIAGGAHLHAGLAGQSGPVVYLLNSNLASDQQSGTFEAGNNQLSFTAGQLDTLRARAFYANIHTMNYASGELRGQVLGLANAYFTTTLAGINEVTPNTSEASGALKLELNGDVLIATGSFTGLESDFNAAIAGGAHLHTAGPSANGGVDVFLSTAVGADMRSGRYGVDSNTFVLEENQIATVLAEGYYANIHSMDIASGELRGQLLTEVNAFPENAPTIISPADGGMVSLVDLGAILNVTWTDSATDDNELTYIWQVATSPSFDTIVFQTNTGANASLDLTYGALDTLLAGLGVEANVTATVYHRAVVSDGAVQAAGAASEANFMRTVTATTDLLAEGSSFEVYPTITRNRVRVEATLSSGEQVNLLVFNAIGQPVKQYSVDLQANQLNEDINMSDQLDGMYFVQLRVDGQVVAVKRIIVRK